jgi:hypothetical protein
MALNTEFTVNLENQPGTLAKVCRALADRNVNVLALQGTPRGGQIRFVTDNPTVTKATLDGEHLTHSETQVAQCRMPNRPGELARAASRLAEIKMNIDWVYSGVESSSNTPLLIFGVADAGRASSILEETAAGAGRR